MSKSHWSADGSEIPDLEIHTQKKHEILGDYLADWIETLCSNHVGQQKRVTIVDAFCGGGVYRDPVSGARHPGSPIRILQSIQVGLDRVKNRRGKPNFTLDFLVILVDEKASHIASLKRAMDEFGFAEMAGNPARVRFVVKSFEYAFDSILAELQARKGHSFLFLDPFGYTQFTMAQLRKLMEVKGSEILLNWMVDYIKRFHDDERTRQALSRVLEADGYFPELKITALESPMQQQYMRHESLRLFRERTRAKYLYSFGLMKATGIVKYYLIHMANNVTAQKVLKTALWKHNNFDLYYRFRFDQYGFGHITPMALEEREQGSLFDIREENRSKCIDQLNQRLIGVITASGLPLRQLEEITLQENPADSSMYQEFLNNSRDEGDVLIYRDGRITTARQIKANDLIRRNPQMRFFL